MPQVVYTKRSTGRIDTRLVDGGGGSDVKLEQRNKNLTFNKAVTFSPKLGKLLSITLSLLQLSSF